MSKPKHRQLYPQIAKSWSGPLMGWTQQTSKVIGFGPWKLELLPLSPPSLSIPFPCPFSGGLRAELLLFYYSDAVYRPVHLSVTNGSRIETASRIELVLHRVYHSLI